MNELDRGKLMDFVTAEIAVFHERRLDRLRRLDLPHILRTKNPYLFRTKNLLTAADLVQAIMDAFLSSSEEKMFGDFLESLAVYVSEQTCNGTKSTAPGIDLEFDRSNYRYLVSIKLVPTGATARSKLSCDRIS